jgi:restriction endonuclease S subunits-like
MIKRIKEICDFVSRGATPDYIDEGENKVMNQATFSKGWLDDNNIRYTSKTSKRAQIKKGDLLIASTGGGVLGKVYFYNSDEKNFYADSHVTILRNSKGTNLMKYLYYHFYLRYDEINATMVKGSTNQTELQKNYLLSYELDIPSIEKQKNMVNYLDSKLSEIDSQVNLLTSKRNAYLRLKKSIINHAVTQGLNPKVKMKDSGVDGIGEIPEHWEIKRMKDICTLSPTIKSCSQFKYGSFLPMEGLRLGQIETSDELVSTIQGKYTPFENNDLLIAKVTPCFENGNIAIAKGLTNGIGFGSSEIFVLRAKKILNIQFLFYMVLSSNFQNKACSTMCGVGGLKRISPLFMKSHTITIPSLIEQRTIAAYLDEKCSKIDKLVANLEKQISLYTDMKRSLIDEVITGKRAV